ncbi:MAG: NTP transferase domain-containing protein [Myxococcales bacterium]|nr:NTP transferase domain-containing protein [Myxococcales bacterium]MCB9530418.1 NTP transferase domain-containing protein [Myxococcales bacterium]MCB9533665.1 NTP transferase domain-containing protein [Myxococcales bacterium]
MSRESPSVLSECPQIREDTTVFEALAAIDRGALGLALVIGADGKLRGTLSDGDIRRAILSGSGLDAAIEGFANPRYLSVRPETDEVDVLQLMLERSVKVVPVLDATGKLLGVHTLQRLVRAKERPETALIMAGGQGTRLGGLTHGIPKPMLPIGDRPLLERLVVHLVSHGVREVLISVHYLSRMIEDHFGDGRRFGCRISYLRESTPLGSGGCLSLVPEHVTGPLLVMNGDLLTRLHLGRFLDRHIERDAAVTVGVRTWTHEVPYGVIEACDERVTAIREKPTFVHRVNAGVYVLSESVWRSVEPNKALPMTDLLISTMESGGRVFEYPFDEQWVDIGLPQDYFAHHRGESDG